MLKENAKKKFINRLNENYKSMFDGDKQKLLTKGQIYYWENLNGIFNIKILSYDSESMIVTFEIIDNTADTSVQKFTLNNFFIFDKEHMEHLYNNAKEFDSEVFSNNDINDIKDYDTECVYIMHNKASDDYSDYYVGQAKHGSWRFKDHLQNAASGIKGNTKRKKTKKAEIQEIEKAMNEMNYTLRFIELESSGFSNLNALEASFIACFNSFHKGYNKTRGNNGPGGVRITKLKD